MRQRLAAILSLLCFMSILLSGCARASYKPVFLPVKFNIDNEGNISVEGELSIVTFVGEFSVGAEYTINPENDNILVVIRDRKKGSRGMDTIYRVRSEKDSFIAVLDGTTTVQVVDRQVVIDVTDARVRTIQLKDPDNTIKVDSNKYYPFQVSGWVLKQGSAWRFFGVFIFILEIFFVIFVLICRLFALVIGDAGLYAGLLTVSLICALITIKKNVIAGILLAIIFVLSLHVITYIYGNLINI